MPHCPCYFPTLPTYRPLRSSLCECVCVRAHILYMCTVSMWDEWLVLPSLYKQLYNSGVSARSEDLWEVALMGRAPYSYFILLRVSLSNTVSAAASTTATATNLIESFFHSFIQPSIHRASVSFIVAALSCLLLRGDLCWPHCICSFFRSRISKYRKKKKKEKKAPPRLMDECSSE